MAKLIELPWLKVVAAVVAEFETTEDERERLTRRYRETGNYEVDRGQFLSGATDRRVKDMIRRSLQVLT